MDTPIQLVFATDAPYVPWTATAILSALEHHPPGLLSIHVLHDVSVQNTALADIERLVTSNGGAVAFHMIDDRRLDTLPGPKHAGQVTWFRLLVPELLPGVARVLLLDADTFVVDSLGPLWATDMEGMPLAAVPNVIEPALRPHVRSLGIDTTRYLNAGVLLMDLEAMRAENSPKELLRFASENADRITWLDQDTLNVGFAGRWHVLHPRWNTMNSLWSWTDWAAEVLGAEAVNEAKATPAILHFEGPAFCKPWHYLSEHAWREEYRATVSRTPWSGTPLLDRTVLTRLIRLLPKAWRLPTYRKLRGDRA